jgi:uncharacterized protein involved in type VI secretion and phage assembly
MQTVDSLEQIVARLVERIEGRYYGKYRGTVSDNQDPDNLGRLRARVPRLLGDVETGWALPCAPYGGAKNQGLFMVPDQGAAVWIEFEGGDLAYPIWCGAWWGDGEVPESATPSQKVLETSSGHKVVLDDDAAKVEVTDSNGNKVTLDQSGIVLEDANQNKVTMDSGGITLRGDLINLGDPATDNLVAFNALQTALTTFVTMLQTHTHVAAGLGAPTGPPVPPPQLTLDPAKAKHKVEL